MSIVIQCPMCQDLDPDAGCRFCSLIPQTSVDDWKLAVAVAKEAPNTGMVPVKSSTLLKINAALVNAIAAQQPAGDVVMDAERYRWLRSTNGTWFDTEGMTPEQIDALIDSARKAGGE